MTFAPSNKTSHASGRMKTVCTSAVLNKLGVRYDSFHYCSCREDMARILRKNGYSVRSRNSTLGKSSTVGELRKKIVNRGEGGKYLVIVDRHVLLLDSDGATICDTDPRVRDRRKIRGVYLVEKNERQKKFDEAFTQHLRDTGQLPPWMTGDEKITDLSLKDVQRIKKWRDDWKNNNG